MRPQSKIKPIVGNYKGWKQIQTPWNSDYGKQYAKRIIDPEGNERLHAGYSKHLTRKELKLDLMYWANEGFEMLTRKRETHDS